MKITLTMNGASTELQRIGRVVFVKQADGTETEHGCFDDAAAQAELERLTQDLLAAGWTESAETRAKREARQRAADAATRRLARHRALANAPHAPAALRAFVGDALPAGRELDAILAKVESIDSPTEGGFRVRVKGGAAIEWAASDDAPLTALWFHPDADDSEHSLYFGADAGPPEPPDELGEVDWFLQEWPQDRYWFTTDAEPTIARCYELDGGLHARESPTRTPEQVLLTRLLDQ
ncbi:MAG: hypothetical protein GQE15_38975 [Archangiaceae bacterium]|nr:hypothetical protein [Archangiaceae bacterium]